MPAAPQRRVSEDHRRSSRPSPARLGRDLRKSGSPPSPGSCRGVAGGAVVIGFSSWLAPYFRRFVQLKRAGGAAFESQERLLARFDRFVGPRRRKPLRRQLLVDYLES